MSTAQMQESWLVQRLRAPLGGHPMARVVEAFSFGGGRVNGGLSKDAMNLLRQVFSFDYMGAAEYEWGAVPDALRKVASAKKLTAFSFTIPLADVASHWRDRKKKAPAGDGTIYVLCAREHADAVERRIRVWATEQFNRDIRDDTGLSRSLRPSDEWDTERCGWLELDNGFFFFTSREMWQATAALFGVSVEAVSA